MEGAETLGIPRNPDYNGARQEGVGFFQRSIHQGKRVSSARAYLHPVMGRSNPDVRTKAHAVSLLFEGKRVVGVRYHQGGEFKEVYARREVILSGGTFNSPQLLQLSGIGDPEFLQTIGVDVVHALSGVGENLVGSLPDSHDRTGRRH